MAVPSKSQTLLRPDNFESGFLIDDRWMAGISRESGEYLAYVVDHQEGGLIARQVFAELNDALAALNQLPRNWRYESASGCSGERCGEGRCKGASCRIYRAPGAEGQGPSKC